MSCAKSLACRDPDSLAGVAQEQHALSCRRQGVDSEEFDRVFGVFCREICEVDGAVWRQCLADVCGYRRVVERQGHERNGGGRTAVTEIVLAAVGKISSCEIAGRLEE